MPHPFDEERQVNVRKFERRERYQKKKKKRHDKWAKFERDKSRKREEW